CERRAWWLAAASPARRAGALRALGRRQYAPLGPRGEMAGGGGGAPRWAGAPPRASSPNAPVACRLDYGTYGVVHAALVAEPDAAAAWQRLCDVAAGEAAPPLLEVLLAAPEALPADAVRELAWSVWRRRTPRARRVCWTAIQPDGSRTHVTLADGGDAPVERVDLLGLHPETARRLDLARMAEFELERLPSAEGLYAFYGRSRRIPS